VIGVVAVAGAMVLTSTSTASASTYGPTGPVSSVGTKVAGGTAYFMEGPGGAPNYIFPFPSAQYFSAANFGQLLSELYRPLYWFGNSNTPAVDLNYSIGQQPVFTNGDKTVTITLNNYKWSDGEQVTSRDVEFFMNMMFAEKDNWGDYTPGFFPDDVVSASYPSSSTFVLNLNHGVNPTWFLYNELSQITPFPIAWDRTSLTQAAPSPTAAHLPDTTTAGIKAVYTFLADQAKNVTTYAASPIWSVVDGPWKVQSFTSTGQITLVPNADYSGSPKPSLAKFVELPFTSDTAIINAIRSLGPSGLSFAELPDEYLTQLKTVESEGYNATNFPSYEFNFFPLNLGNPTYGPVFKQLYFRQALQHLVDQSGWVSHILDGYAVPTYGPVPTAPKNSFADAQELSDPYPFSISDAANLLKANGWGDVALGKTAYCAKPGSGTGECGAGIPSGFKLAFGIDYQAGAVITQEEMLDLKAQASQVGMNIELTSQPFDQIISKLTDCGPGGQSKPSSPACKWTGLNFGGGWVYAPDFEPTGESLFYTGSAADYEGYSSAEADKLIEASTTAPASQAQAALDAYENYIIQQVPAVFVPTPTGDPTVASIVLTSKHLGGYTNNVYAYLTPETWYLTK
jgi:peptide/nickel transport system substrate-binding protein